MWKVTTFYSGFLGATLLIVLQCADCALAQSAPISPDHSWHAPAEQSIEADARNIPDLRFTIDSAKTYSLPELIDLAETHNPETRVSLATSTLAGSGLGRGKERVISDVGGCRTL